MELTSLWISVTAPGREDINFSFTAQTVRLAVDMETGKIDVKDFIIAHDGGFPLHPMSVEGQNEGGAVQGLGQAIYEGFIMEKGKTYNSTLLDYKMPRSTDVPDIKVMKSSLTILMVLMGPRKFPREAM